METLVNQKSAFAKTPDLSPSCLKCGRLNVCAVFRAIKPLMGNWEDAKTRPFEAEKVAAICGQYAENFVVFNSPKPGEEIGRTI